MAQAAIIPQSLLARLSKLLCEVEHRRKDQQLRLSLLDQIIFQGITGADFNTIPKAFGQGHQDRDILSYIHDLGCPRYVERQVIQLEIIDAPSRFQSCINELLVFEIRSLVNPPTVAFLYEVRALHCMRGASGIARLVGVVTDDEGETLKAYLIEYPRARHNVMHVAGDPAIAFVRREKWAAQLFQGVAQIHEQGLVVGGLTIFTTPLVLEHTDTALFRMFRNRIIPGRTVGSYYPPEFRHLRHISPQLDEKDWPCATSKTDVFHLGQLLWLLAENKPITRPSPNCMRQKCSTLGGDACDLSHVEPIVFPPLPESVSKYYREIVDQCQAENPGARPATRDLLKNFPVLGDPPRSQKVGQSYGEGIKLAIEGLQMSKVACSVYWLLDMTGPPRTTHLSLQRLLYGRL